MNEFDTNSKLRELIRSTLDMPENAVRPAHQNAPIFKGEEYITVQILSEVSEGTDNTSLLPIADEELFANERLWGQRLVSANIQYYNGDAMRQLRALVQRFQSMVGVQLFEDAGFGFVNATITDLTGLLPDELWQTRAVLRLDFYAVVEETVKTPLIVKLPLTVHTSRDTTETIVYPGQSMQGPAPWLAFESGTGETIRLDEVNQ